MDGVANWFDTHQPPLSEVQDGFKLRTKNFHEQNRVAATI
jgi:hypothetical protein